MEATLERSRGRFGGLDGFQLKLFALITMTMDHLAAYLPAGANIPDWFHLIGRFAAPLFLFFCAEGFFYTHSRAKYVGRLYVASVLMSFCNYQIDSRFMFNNVPIMNAMFSTMFIVTLTLWAIESLREGRKEHNRRKIIGGLIGFAYLVCGVTLQLGFAMGLYSMVDTNGFLIQNTTSKILQYAVQGVNLFVPNLLTVEGGPLFALLGIAFFYLRKWRWAQVAALGVLCLIEFAAVPEYWVTDLFVFMAAVPMLLYNGKPGAKRHKYLFYWYYPLHVYVIYIAGWAMVTYLSIAA